MSLATSNTRVLSLFVSMMALFGMMALPAQADTGPLQAGVVVFEGEAVIGQEIAKNHGAKTQECVLNVDKGLNFPVTTQPALKAGTNRCYHFEADQNLFPDQACLGLTTKLELGACRIEVEGNVGAVTEVDGFKVGAWCGLSEGWAGKGSLDFKDSGGTIYVTNVGWVTSAGSLIPVVGSASKAKDGKDGLLVGLVDALGNEHDDPQLAKACLNNNEADSFQVVGIAAATGDK